MLFLIVPVWPAGIANASEVTETETFDGTDGAQVTDLGIPSGNYAVDDGDNVAIRNDQNCCGVGGQYFFSLLDNQTQQNANTTGFTFTLPTDHDIKEVGFRTAGVNTAYTIQYNYSDSTNETVNYNGQAGSQYEDITKSITGKYITSFVITVSDWSGIDTIYWKYDSTPVTTTTTVPSVGVPTNFTVTKNSNGSITVDWDAPTSGNQTPDRYTVQYGDNGVLDQNPTTTDTEITLTRSQLETALSLNNSEGIAYMFRVKAENVAQSIESDFTDVETITISQAPDNSASTYSVTQTTTGMKIEWTAPTSNWVDITGYKIIYSETDSDDYNSSVWQYLYISSDTSVTEYTIPWTDNFDNSTYGTINGTNYFRISTCAASAWCNDVKDSFTVDNTLGPPMDPTVENVYDTGVLVEWDAPNTGSRTTQTYDLYYRINGSQDNTIVTGITDTEYTIPYNAITDNTYVFSIQAKNSDYNVASGYSTEPLLSVVNQKVVDDNAAAQAIADAQAAAEAEAQAEADRIAAAVQWERDQNFAETGVSETDSERRDRESRTFIVGGEETEYTQGEVDDGTVERDQERQKNLELYGVELTNEQILRGDAGDIELIEEDEEEYDEIEGGEFPEDDNLVYIPEDEYDGDDIVYEVYDEDEGWVEVSEEEFEEILEYEAELDAKELEILDTYDDEYLEDLNLYIPEEEFEGLTEEEIFELEEELQREFEEFIETILQVEEYLEDLEVYEQEIIVFEVTDLENVIIIIEEPEDFPEDFPEDELPPVIIIEDFPDEGPVERPYEDEVFVDELEEEELEILTEEEYEEYKEERKEVIETYVEELEVEIIEEILPETVTVEEFEEIKEKDIEELTEEEVEIVVEVAAEVIEEVVNIEELEEVIVAEDIEILQEEELEELSEKELEAYEEEIEEVITEYVQELATEELVVVVEQVAEVGVENLSSADEQTVKVIQAVVTEVVNVETVEELSEEEVEAVAEVLGFTEEEAAEDVQIIAEQAATDENVAEAVDEFVERAVEAAEEAVSQPYTIADAVTEVQTEAFLADPIGAIIDIDIGEITVSAVGNDMTSDQKEKAQEVVVPVIIASQIASLAGSVTRMRF